MVETEDSTAPSLCQLSKLPAALVQHVVSFAVGEDALAFFGQPKQPCVACRRHRASNPLTREPLPSAVVNQR